MEANIQFVHLSIIVGTLIPLLVGVVTKMRASSQVKSIANALLSAVAGALVPVINACAGDTCAVNWREVALGVGVTWIASVATYYGLWKPTGTADSVQARTAGVGIGGS